MTTAEITAIESILKQFHKFYSDLKEVKERTDFSDPSTLPKTQSDLVGILEHHSLNLHPLSEHGDDKLFNELLYLLTVFTDEFFIYTPWNGKNIWEENLLEERTFNSHVAGDLLFSRLDTHLQAPNRLSDSILIIYYLVLCLGFQGKYMHDDREQKLKYYRKQLYAYIYQSKPFTFDIIKQLFPKAYSHTHYYKGAIKLPNYFQRISIGVVSFIASIGLVLLLFYSRAIYYKTSALLKFISRNYTSIIVWSIGIGLLILLVIIAVRLFRHYKLKNLPKNVYTKFEIRESYRYILKLLKAHFDRFNYKYTLPVYLAFGLEDAGTTSLLQESRLKKILKNPFDDFDLGKYACKWFMFQQAIVLDVAGDLDSGNKEIPLWHYLIKKIKHKRYRRPIDGIITTISADSLIPSDDESLNSLEMIKHKAALLEEKISIVQQRLRMKLPVYVVITKCDQIAGYRTFVKEIPENHHDDIFGWSNPYNPSVYAYSKEWIAEAFLQLNHQISFLMFGFFSNGADIKDFHKLFKFKNQIESMKYPLQIFTNKIFTPNQFSHASPLLFRGIYFTGSNPKIDQKTGIRNTLFVKDLFNSKIFKEYSLAKPYSFSRLLK